MWASSFANSLVCTIDLLMLQREEYLIGLNKIVFITKFAENHLKSFEIAESRESCEKYAKNIKNCLKFAKR